MNLAEFKDLLSAWQLIAPVKSWMKIKWVVIKKSEVGVFVSCQDQWITGIILPKEVKELERGGFDLSIGTSLEAEVLSTDLIDEEGNYTISISKLLQYDIWNSILEKYKAWDVITVVPTEANLGWLLVDMHWIKWFIPLSQLAPVHYPRVEDGDQEKIFEALLSLIYKEFHVRIINLDENGKRMIFSEREALREEREKIMSTLQVGNEYEWVISWVSSYWLFVTIWWGIEWLVHISEITYWHVDSIERFGKVWETVNVKVIGFEDGKISLSLKQLKWDPWSIIPQNFKVWDVIDGEVIRYVPYGVFIRVFDDINWLVHLSEVSDRPISNPAEAVKLWQKVKARIILLDGPARKIGLSIKSVKSEGGDSADRGGEKKPRPQYKRKPEDQSSDRPAKPTTFRKKSEVEETVSTDAKPSKKKTEKTE